MLVSPVMIRTHSIHIWNIRRLNILAAAAVLRHGLQEKPRSQSSAKPLLKRGRKVGSAGIRILFQDGFATSLCNS